MIYKERIKLKETKTRFLLLSHDILLVRWKLRLCFSAYYRIVLVAIEAIEQRFAYLK